MLILTDADGLRIDLDQLRQRILQPSGNGRGRPLSDIKIRKFFSGEFACRINGSSRLVHNHIGKRQIEFLDPGCYQCFRLSGRRSVSYRNQIDMIPVDQFLDLPFGFLHLVLRGGRINHLGIQDLSGRIHNRQLTTGAEGGIPSQYRFACNRGLHQKLRQIFAKNSNGAVLCLLR